jgi:hypothetical protein
MFSRKTKFVFPISAVHLFCDSVDYAQNPKISFIIAEVSLEIKGGNGIDMHANFSKISEDICEGCNWGFWIFSIT